MPALRKFSAGFFLAEDVQRRAVGPQQTVSDPLTRRHMADTLSPRERVWSFYIFTRGPTLRPAGW